MKKLILLFLLFSSTLAFSQSGSNNTIGGRSNGVANASVGFTGINSIFSNQAGLADLKTMGFIFASEQRFLLNDLNNLGGGFALPTNSGTFGLVVNYFGFEQYNESKIGLNYARKLMEKLSVGIQFDILRTQISQYGSQNFYTFEVGLQSEIIENLLIGIHIYNPVKLEIAENEFLPSIFRGGATYRPSKKLNLHVELEKDFDLPFIFKSGVEYELAKEFWLRLGVQTSPTAFSFGLGYQFKNGLFLDLATNYHQELGATPNIGVGYKFFKNKN